MADVHALRTSPWIVFSNTFRSSGMIPCRVDSEAEMRYVLEPDHRNMLTGWARMRDAKIQFPDAEEPSVEVRNAIADIAALDLRRRRVHVRSLVLRGTTLQPESQLGATMLSSLKDERRGRNRRGRKTAPTVRRPGDGPSTDSTRSAAHSCACRARRTKRSTS